MKSLIWIIIIVMIQLIVLVSCRNTNDYKVTQAKSIEINNLYKKGAYQQVIKSSQELITIYATYKQYDSILLIYDYVLIPALIELNKLDTLVYLLPKIRPYLNTSSPYHTDIYGLIASSYNLNNNYDSTLYYFDKAKQSINWIANPDTKEAALSKLYSMQAVFYQTVGDYQQAEQLFKEVLTRYRHQINEIDTTEFVNAYNSIFYNYTKKDCWEIANIYKDSILLYDANQTKTDIYHNIAHYYLYHPNPNYDSAEYYIRKKIAIHQQYKHLSSNEKGRNFKFLGEVLYHQGKYRQALDSIKIALALRKTDKVGMAATWLVAGQIYQAMKKTTNAFEAIQNGLYEVSNHSFENKQVAYNPSIHTILSPDYAFQLLVEKVNLLMITHQPLLALETCKTIDSLIDETRLHFTTDGSKLIWAEKVSTIYQQAVKLAITLKQPETAFHFTEKGKSFVLFSALKEIDINVLPIEIRQYQQALYQRLNYYQTHNNQPDSVFHIQQKLAKLKQELLNHREYYQLLHETNTDSMAQLQKRLDKEQAIISYYVGENEIVAFVITPTSMQTILLDKPQDSTLDKYCHLLADITCDVGIYQSLAYSLYQQLVAPILPYAPQKRWLIIPDNHLNYLPFETLLTQATHQQSYNNLPYLLYKKSIAYHYSATLWNYLSQAQMITKLQKSYFLCAVDSFGDYNYELGDFKPFIPSIKQIIKQQLGLGDTLSPNQKEAFVKKFQLNETVHYPLAILFTHSAANDKASDSSWVAFEDKYLYLSEIFSLHINADLLILSSCESGAGKLQKGEGLMSLARGFMFAGSHNLLPTHWRVEPNANTFFLNQFIPLLKQGYSKDEALQLAKINYLKAHPTQKPYYWAAPFLIGNTNPIQFYHQQETTPVKPNYWVYIIGIFLLFCSLLGWYYFRRK